MTRNRAKWVVAALVVVAAGTSSYLLTQSLAGDSSPSRAAEDPQLVDDAIATAVDRTNDILAEEGAKETFVGVMGDFTVLPQDELPSDYPCEPLKAVTPTAASELYFELEDGTAPQRARACADGLVLLASGASWLNSDATSHFDMERRHFTGTRPQVSLLVPADRLELTDIDGHPAIVARAISETDTLLRRRTIYVIERAASDDAPGIVLRVSGSGPDEDMLSLAREILAK